MKHFLVAFWYIVYVISVVAVIRDFQQAIFGQAFVGFLFGMIASYMAGYWAVIYTGLDRYLYENFNDEE